MRISLARATDEELEALLERQGPRSTRLITAGVVEGGTVRVTTSKGKVLLLQKHHLIDEEWYLLRFGRDMLWDDIGLVQLHESEIVVGRAISYTVLSNKLSSEDIGKVQEIVVLGNSLRGPA